jgi:riboflavin kinase / FMN adenylyltransferase
MSLADPQSTAITIGTFDGVHAGHAALLRRARHVVGPAGQVVALAFDPHPLTLLRPNAAPPRLTSWERRAEFLRIAGADRVERLKPTDDLLALSPRDFIKRTVDAHHPRAFVEGKDFRFGKARAGDMTVLAELGRDMGFEAVIVPQELVVLTDHTIAPASSTFTRWLLSHGRVRDAALVLGRPPELEGIVTSGDRRGRTIGFPTANLRTDHLLPADGVYGGIAHLPDASSYPAAINIGMRPTFHGMERRVECHLILKSKTPDAGVVSWAELPGVDEYNWPLRVQLLSWIRDQVKFESIDALIAQVRRDCARVIESLSRVTQPLVPDDAGKLDPTRLDSIRAALPRTTAHLPTARTGAPN